MLLWVLIGLFFSLEAHSLDETINLAFENNPNAFIPYYEIQKYEGEYDLAGLLPNPVFNYSVKWGGPKVDASWLAPLTKWFALPLDRRVALDQVFKSWVQAYEASLDLALDVEMGYYEAKEKRWQADLLEQLFELKELTRDLAKGQFEAGNVNNLFLLEAEKEKARVEKERGLFRERAIDAAKGLNILTGVSVEADGTTPMAHVSVDPKALLFTNPLLESLRWEAETRRDALNALPWWRFLNLDLGPSYEREIGGAKVWGPSVNASFPLIRNGWPERFMERVRLEIACLKIAAEEIRIENEATALLREQEETITSLAAAEKEIALLTRTIEEGERYTHVMNLSPYTLLAMYEQKIQAEIGRSDLLLKLIRQNASLARLAGAPLCAEPLFFSQEEPFKEPSYISEKETASAPSRLVVPNGSILPYVEANGVKEFHLIAKESLQEFAPGFVVKVWGYNGASPGPVIEATEGDTVRIKVTNELPEATTVHWHGLIVPWKMDGVVGLTQPPIQPGETYTYEFTLKQNGTYMYHSHTDEMTQIALGAFGFFIIHPKNEEKVDRDFLLFLHEWYIPPGAARPDPMVMTDFNYFTFNGKVFPGTERMKAKKGDRIRIRLANLSLNNHPIHVHGTEFTVVRRGASRLKESAQYTENTVDVPPGATRDIEFTADNGGLWAIHCHKSHHVFNGMNHSFPNLIGMEGDAIGKRLKKFFPNFILMGTNGMSDMFSGHHNGILPPNFLPYGTPGPFGVIEMGGMFTILQVDE